MFGDLILRMPDMTHAIYDKNKHWEFLIGWAVWFSMESGVFKGPHEELLTLVSGCIRIVLVRYVIRHICVLLFPGVHMIVLWNYNNEHFYCRVSYLFK